MECHICTQRFDPRDRRPKVLPCGHSFCLKCLRRLESKKCPLDNKIFKSLPDKLADNYSLLEACNAPAESTHPRLWCRRCSKNPSDDCVEQEHPVTTFKKWRASEVESTVEMLEGHASILDGFAHAVDAEAVSAEVADFHQELEQWKGRLKSPIGAQEGEHFLDVGTSISRSNLQSMWDLLSNGSLAQVRFLVGLPFSAFPPWCQKVLEQVTPQLEGRRWPPL
ncbi:uncharacterized protein LOC117640118 isoform X3 [Thrips palmi]|nr:uncharacterized protein LOC117640118 isoform X3 [Thrips palmi]XP_034232271.1 uncharacterized protein LOC117640118 isoform X3 [Thrips palmi]